MAAEGPIVAVQEALIRDKFLTGEVSGVHDKATREALQKFQAYHSLPPTGEIDTATLEALQSDVPTKPAPALAVQPLPKAVVQGDRQFLDGLVNGEEKTSGNGEPAAVPTPAPPAEPPVSPVAAGAVAKEERSPAPVKPAKVATAPRPKSKPRVAPVREPSAVPKNDQPFVAEGTSREAQPAPGQVPRRAQGTPSPRANANVSNSDGSSGSGETGEGLNVPQGKTVRIRTTKTTGPDGRTYVTQTTSTTPGAAPSPEVAARKAVEVQPRTKRVGLFDRIHIFRDNADD
jgi:hypothetical protein